ncbi:hypothetical protein H6P81_006628 [Aristolochia fimbriata]|uniref:Uncharacterized protein n=1 Tax=Aristolochia fimbriata TaxID=158543 RepID=A0AAV7EZ02_ARIFI|nr:hypothetical protein H6P81_006628 [Aristolochia fimbriata]
MVPFDQSGTWLVVLFLVASKALGTKASGVKKQKAVFVKETIKVMKVPLQATLASVKRRPSVKKKPVPEQVDLTPHNSEKRHRSSLPLQADCAMIVPLGVAPCTSIPPLPILAPPPLLPGPSQDMPGKLGTSTEDNVTLGGLARKEFDGGYRFR